MKSKLFLAEKATLPFLFIAGFTASEAVLTTDIAGTSSLEMKFRADDKAYVYADGVYYDKYTGHRKLHTVQLPANTKVVAVKLFNFLSVAGFLTEISNGVVSGPAWKCTQHEPQGTGILYLPGNSSELLI